MGQLRDTARLASLGLIMVSAAAVAAALSQPWSWPAPPAADQPQPGSTLGLALFGPVLSGACLVALWRLRHGRPPGANRLARRISVVGVLGGAVAGMAALYAAGYGEPAVGIRVGGPLAVLGCAALVLGWVLLIPGAGAEPARWGAGPVAGAMALLLALGLGAVFAIPWYAEGRFVDQYTTDALPALATDLPARLDREQWRVDLVSPPPVGGWTAVHGRYLLVSQPGGVTAFDAVTGQRRWSYRRTDRQVVAAAVTPDGATTIVVYHSELWRITPALVVALDTATGRVRGQHLHLDRTRDRVYPTGRLVLAGADVLVGGKSGVPPFTALDTRSGVRRWNWGTYDGVNCPANSLALAAGTLVVAIRCHDTVRVTALSIVDGSTRWTWRPDLADQVAVHAVGDRLLATYREALHPGDQVGVVLDPVTGATNAQHQVPGSFAAAARDTAVYLGATSTGVDLATGTTRWSRATPQLDGWTPISAAHLAGTHYVLLRGPSPQDPNVRTRTDGRPPPIPWALEAGVDPDGGGALRVVALDVATGAIHADQTYNLLPATACPPDTSSCPRRTASLLLAPGRLIIAEYLDDWHYPPKIQTRLAAFG